MSLSHTSPMERREEVSGARLRGTLQRGEGLETYRKVEVYMMEEDKTLRKINVLEWWCVCVGGGYRGEESIEKRKGRGRGREKF